MCTHLRNNKRAVLELWCFWLYFYKHTQKQFRGNNRKHVCMQRINNFGSSLEWARNTYMVEPTGAWLEASFPSWCTSWTLLALFLQGTLRTVNLDAYSYFFAWERSFDWTAKSRRKSTVRLTRFLSLHGVKLQQNCRTQNTKIVSAANFPRKLF